MTHTGTTFHKAVDKMLKCGSAEGKMRNAKCRKMLRNGG